MKPKPPGPLPPCMGLIYAPTASPPHKHTQAAAKCKQHGASCKIHQHLGSCKAEKAQGITSPSPAAGGCLLARVAGLAGAVCSGCQGKCRMFNLRGYTQSPTTVLVII